MTVAERQIHDQIKRKLEAEVCLFWESLEQCDGCGEVKQIWEIWVGLDGRFLCGQCKKD